ncbi:MAG: phosphatase PAP2 family protein [Saprospiraceae bacterium]
MTAIINELKPFLVACLVFWLACLLILWSLPLAGDLAFFNSWRGSWTDPLFIYGTRMGEEFGYLVITMVAVVYKWKHAWWVPLTGVIVTVVSFLTKMLFRSPRPGFFLHDPNFADQIILVDGITPLSGLTSFPSGHTMGAFALATFTICFFRWSRSGWWVVLFVLAVIVGISRMYLVMHFLKDVLLGSVMGVLIGAGMVYLYRLWAGRRPGPQAEASSTS